MMAFESQHCLVRLTESMWKLIFVTPPSPLAKLFSLDFIRHIWQEFSNTSVQKLLLFMLTCFFIFFMSGKSVGSRRWANNIDLFLNQMMIITVHLIMGHFKCQVVKRNHVLSKLCFHLRSKNNSNSNKNTVYCSFRANKH